MSANRSLTRSLPLVAISMSLIGCASMKGGQVSSAEDSALLAEKDQEIARLSSEIASMERSLTEEQKEELQTMRQEYLDSVKAKLEEWGVEPPEVHGPRPGGMGFRGRGARGFGLLKP